MKRRSSPQLPLQVAAGLQALLKFQERASVKADPVGAVRAILEAAKQSRSRR